MLFEPRSSLTAEIVGQAGFDFVVIDLEHGAGSEGDVTAQLQALVHTNTAAVIRVESHERQRAHRVLDAGAHGIMFPVSTMSGRRETRWRPFVTRRPVWEVWHQ